ncbi:hypothetical protein BDP55DRAFT_378381 [Colletotrichum godetiae]|uniref:Uncharacterized protein n=1 Tax=Colletotrichum godetiae TaxID=1209918 RepID=A0AAJ0AUB9_9PEZI|nr:uncharacterized protein BDP55DRAFT_378381 [Colletotrichum godetiae]KAK1689777.1 hypothetical protein BDP55DRAFT_378381 [Colletotrichum godetiae]
MYCYACASMRRYLGQSARGGFVTGCQDHLQSAPKCGSPGNPVLSSSPKHHTPSSTDHNNKLMDGDHGISRELSFSRRLPAPSASSPPQTTIFSGSSPDLYGERLPSPSSRSFPSARHPNSFVFSLVETAAVRNMAKYWEQRGKSKEVPAVSSLSLPSRLAQISNGIADWLVISRNGPRGTLKVKYLGSCTLGPWSRLHTRPTCAVRTS